MRCPWKRKERKRVKERRGTHLGSQSGGRDSRGDQAARENLKELEQRIPSGKPAGEQSLWKQIGNKKELIASGEFNDLIPLVPGELNASKKVETERIKREDKGRSVYLSSEDPYGKEVDPLS